MYLKRSERLVGCSTILTRRSESFMGRRLRISLNGRSDRIDRKTSCTFKRSEHLVEDGSILTRRSESIMGRKKILDRGSSCFFTSSRRSQRLVGCGPILTRMSESIIGRRIIYASEKETIASMEKADVTSKKVSALWDMAQSSPEESKSSREEG
jgi:hypothetical protein